jgi:hypothetical protein
MPVQENRLPTFLTELLVPLTERLIALEEAVARRRHPPTPPPEEPVVVAAMTPAVTPTKEQGGWMDMIAKFQKLRAPEFTGEQGPLAADKWKKDITNILDLMGIETVLMQRLAAFTLKGDASKWYQSHFTKEERLTATWEEFIYRFDMQYISAATLAAYESKFESLCQEGQKAKEVAAKVVIPSDGKGKGKRPFAATAQGGQQQKGPTQEG